MSTIKQRLPFVLLAVGLFGFIWWLCAVTNIPFDADNPLEGAHGICAIVDWDGPSAVYDCTEQQRELAIEAAHSRFNVAASLISLAFALAITFLFWEANDSMNKKIRSMPSSR